MGRNKEFTLPQSKYKSQWYSKLLLWGLFIAFSLTNFDCKKDETNNADYYVKYEVNSSTIYYGNHLRVVLTDANNQSTIFTINARTPWETTIGPVKKGFNANLSVSDISNNYGHLTLQAQISVSKNSSPFTLKQSDDSNTPRTKVQINYAIDY